MDDEELTVSELVERLMKLPAGLKVRTWEDVRLYPIREASVVNEDEDGYWTENSGEPVVVIR